MRVLILHDVVGATARPDEQDALIQASHVQAGLERLGHATSRFPCDLDLGRLRVAIGESRPDVAFNLVESLGGHGRLIHLVPDLLDATGIRYTGAPAQAVYATSNKLLAKRVLFANGISTPAWLARAAQPASVHATAPWQTQTRWIIKSNWEHASIGLSAASIASYASRSELMEALEQAAWNVSGGAFAEEFIDGREFNLSLLADTAGPQVLPPAEIDFSAFAAGRARIVGYDAKWTPGSFEFEHTPRRFDFPETDANLLRRLRDLALQCWDIFALRGYARVDFRIDSSGRPWVLEVNANPCLSADAGFAAALQRGAISFDAALRRILDDAAAA